MTVTHSAVVVLMMTIFSKKSSKRKYLWRMEKAWKKNQYLSARNHQYYRKKSDFSDPLIRNTITQRSFCSLLWKERKYIDGWIHSVRRISKQHCLSQHVIDFWLILYPEKLILVWKKSFLFEQAGQHLCNQILSQGSIYYNTTGQGRSAPQSFE